MSTKTNHWSALTMPAVEIAQRMPTVFLADVSRRFTSGFPCR